MTEAKLGLLNRQNGINQAVVKDQLKHEFHCQALFWHLGHSAPVAKEPISQSAIYMEAPRIYNKIQIHIQVNLTCFAQPNMNFELAACTAERDLSDKRKFCKIL